MGFPPDRRVPFVDAVVRVIEGDGTVKEARGLLRAIERRHGVFLRPAYAGRAAMDPALVDAWVEEHLYPFLDETHLTLTGGDFRNDVDICDAEGGELGASWRGWGGIVAEWANRRGWPTTCPRRGRRWEYIDFYMDVYAGAKLERYADFARVVRQVIGVVERA